MIKRLYLHQFRNYEKAEVEFGQGVNWITGKNAQGKTNLLEALFLLSTGRSFRTRYLSELIQEGASFFYLELDFEQDGLSQRITLQFSRDEKKLNFNGTLHSHFTPLIGHLPHVIYAPEDRALVTGIPSQRRKFLDLHLCQLDPLYLQYLVRYHKALRQRNALLKKKSVRSIDTWEEMMAVSGRYLVGKREQMASEFIEPLQTSMSALSQENDRLEIRYESSCLNKSEEELMRQWKEQREKELYVGSTLFGPHRDDLQFFIGGRLAKQFASEGQKQSIIAALRLCQYEHLKSQLFSIDDFGMHLDPLRQEKFQSLLEQQVGQLFITSAESKPSIFPNKHSIVIGSGQVLEKSSA